MQIIGVATLEQNVHLQDRALSSYALNHQTSRLSFDPGSLGLSVSLCLCLSVSLLGLLRSGCPVGLSAETHSIPLSLGITYFVRLHSRRKVRYANLILICSHLFRNFRSYEMNVFCN
jgi:hypothetical protein